VTARPAFELADVLHRHGESYERANAGHLGRVERRVIGAITACRTAALGGHVERCDDCGLTRIVYNSCRNRHCGKCQGAARAEWLAARQAELLPVPYFHVVFTLPPAAAEIAFQNKQAVYGLLMRAAAQALMTLAAERLGATIGLIAVLHTWGQTLTHHPHVHCLVTGGGVALDGRRWVACKPNFLLSVRALSNTFRRLFLDGLEAAFRRSELGFFGDLVPLAEATAFAKRVRALRQSAFVVYAKPPFGGPERVLAISPATRIARRSPIRDLSPSMTIRWRSPIRIIAAAAAAASCGLPRTSSSVAFSSTSCPTASIASVTTASLPRATETRRSRVCAACFSSNRPASLTPPASQRQTNTLASRSLSARTAAVSCGASAMSPNARLPPSAATHRDIKSRPHLDPSPPPTRRLPGADAACHRRSHSPRFGHDRVIAMQPKSHRGAFETVRRSPPAKARSANRASKTRTVPALSP
jgi:hypothetical protein